MIRCAVIDTTTGEVVNAVEYDEVPVGTPPGMEDGLIAVASDTAGPGFSYKDGVFTDNTPPLPPPPPMPPPPGAAVMYDHENRLRSMEGEPPLTMEDFLVKMRGGELQ